MMTFTHWIPLAAVCTLGAISPGPSLALIINNIVQTGRRGGVVTAVGHGLGVALYALITSMGLGVIITNTPWLFNLIQYAGAGFLLYMAFKILRASPDESASAKKEEGRFVGFGGGFLVAFLNPKLAIFFLALFSQFVADNLTFSDQLIMAMTASGIDILWYGLVALGIGSTGFLGWLQKNSHWVDRISAFVFIALALLVISR
ncbi:LysE family translocator [Parendozoicomonas sp. Alg238-R29]|uniref:LysE family translocator n=1 Tax=Parendozoicomonas sp. Alg238-R29 TaxID=2993446 RepID=UPI00248D5E2B|nr:LysE family translocator [Parendozoicomonas sp. Alg238-R29]